MTGPAPIFDGPGLVTRRVRVAQGDVAWIRWVLEAHEGLASLHGTGDGTITLLAPVERAAELDRVLADLGEELELEVLG